VGKLASGELKAIVSFEGGRLDRIKDVPTLKEKGYPDLVLHGWFGYVAPAGTPQDILDKLGKAMRETIKDPAIVAAVRKMDFNEAYLPPEELRD
jgi:tripartite-type tricarboxylate transporter receptor subunit TctC